MMQYNNEQQLAINAKEDKIIITAPPGSGKTSTLVGAIEKYAEENPADNIVAVTFTKKGAADLQTKINNESVEVATIHSWSYKVLQYYAGEYNFTVSLLQEEMIKDILKRIMVKLRISYLNMFLLYSYVMGNYNIDVDDTVIRKFDKIKDVYIEFKRRNKLYDFTDLPLYLHDILEEYNESIDFIDALFVDEFQDVDDIQISIFDKVNAKKKVYIGDVKQSIYGFRGASGDAFFTQKDFTHYNLKINYRSYQEIIDFADDINQTYWFNPNTKTILESVREDEDLIQSNIECIKGYGGLVAGIIDVDEGINIVTKEPIDCAALLQELIADKRTQILCRSNRQVKKILSHNIANVSTIHQAKGLEYDNVIVVDFPLSADEENNVAYVAMTRARNNLVVIDYDTLLYYICSLGLEQSFKLF